MQKKLVVIAHDMRSTHNVGSLLRTAEGLGITQVYLTGYTPYPPLIDGERRLPHIAQKLGKQIEKTALGAEKLVPWAHYDDIEECLTMLKHTGYTIVGLEQTADSVPLPSYTASADTAVLLGREVEGIAPELLTYCDATVEIPMSGEKESFNVVQAAAMTLYQLRFQA